MVAHSYFDTSKPYASIMQFAEGKLQLFSEEQRVFLKTVHDFFEREAFQGYLNGKCSPKLPSKLEKTFFSVALPVFLKSMDCSNEKKQRLLACIKSVTKPFFPKFKVGDEGQIDEATCSLRDAIREINRGGISETAKNRNRTCDLRITNAGEVYSIRYDSAALSMILRQLRLKYYWILSDFDGTFSERLHRKIILKILILRF